MFNFIAYLNKKAAEWTHFPPEKVAAMAQAQVRFVNAHETEIRTPTPANKKARKMEQDELVSQLRLFVRLYMYNPDFVTQVDLTELMLPLHDTVRTPTHRPTEQVETDIEIRGIRRVYLHFKERGAPSKAKPRCAAGAYVVYCVGAKVEDMSHTVFSSRSPHVMTFPDSERAKTVSMAVCWENSRGEKGPWSEIISTIVP